MKKQKKTTLLKKTSKAFILISSILMVISIIVLYFYIRHIMQNEVEEELYSRRYRLEHYLEQNEALIELPPVFEINKTEKLGAETLKDTLIYDPSQDETELFRELTSYMHVNDNDYQIIVRSMVVESEDIILVIFLSFFGIIFLIFCIQFYFSQAWNKILWKPFFNNLEQMKTFSIKSAEPLKLEESEILEFSDLKDEITALTGKVAADYNNLKQFTEDVSHELQTPLAIMQAKIENLLNDIRITDNQFAQFSSLQKDIQRLAQLNKKMVLLTKLENQQFKRTAKIDFNEMVRETLENFKELTSIPIIFTEESDISLQADRELLQILCNNLISNAIKYCAAEGKIGVEIKKSGFMVRNSGENKLKNTEKLFTRFYRENSNLKSSTGLGLAIVKKICDEYGYKLTYDFESGEHLFRVSFNQ